MVKFPCCLLICHRRNAFCNRENRFVDGWGKEFSDGISFTIIRFGNSIRVEFTWRKSNYLMFLHSIRLGKSSKNFSNETINEEIKSGLIRCDFSSFSGDFSSFTRVFILFFLVFPALNFLTSCACLLQVQACQFHKPELKLWIILMKSNFATVLLSHFLSKQLFVAIVS